MVRIEEDINKPQEENMMGEIPKSPEKRDDREAFQKYHHEETDQKNLHDEPSDMQVIELQNDTNQVREDNQNDVQLNFDDDDFDDFQ